MRIYLDTAPIIYLVEEKEPFREKVISHLRDKNATLQTSEMARLESRVKPMREKDAVLLAAYDEFFAEDFKQIIGLTRDVMDTATELRAKYNFKTPD